MGDTNLYQKTNVRECILARYSFCSTVLDGGRPFSAILFPDKRLSMENKPSSRQPSFIPFSLPVFEQSEQP